MEEEFQSECFASDVPLLPTPSKSTVQPLLYPPKRYTIMLFENQYVLTLSVHA